MEYEVDNHPDTPFYKRHAGACFQMEYTHVHKQDYDDRLLADMTTLDYVSRTIVYHYFSRLVPSMSGSLSRAPADLFSVNRHLHRRLLRPGDDPHASPLPEVGEPSGDRKRSRELGNLSSLSANVRHDDQGNGRPSSGEDLSHTDYMLYDHFVETIMPNVFSESLNARLSSRGSAQTRHVMVILHGLRALGSFAALHYLSKDEYYDGRLVGPEDGRARYPGLEARLKDIAAKADDGPLRSLFQTGWSVCRPLDPLLPPRAFTPAETKLDKEHLVKARNLEFFNTVEHQRKLRGDPSLTVTEHLGEIFAITPHHYQKIAPFTVPKKQISDLHESIKKTIAGTQKIRKAIKIDRIDENQILDAMSLPRDRNFRRHDIYSLGSFERKKTVLTQQNRALTLIHALFKAGKINRQKKVVIVGGGVSGMSAAMAASEAGARVVMLETDDMLIPLQAACTHRFLHPYFYDWPGPRCGVTETNFAIEEMNWKAGDARSVLGQLFGQFLQYGERRNQEGDRTKFTVYTRWPVRMILRDRINGKHIVSRRRFRENDKDPSILELSPPDSPYSETPNTPVTCGYAQPDLAVYPPSRWKTAASALVRDLQNRTSPRKKPVALLPGARDDQTLASDEIVDCDILIFATGFGREHPKEEMAALGIPPHLLLNDSYWIDDEVAFRDTGKDEQVYIVSGSGDGALIDILRLCIRQASEDPNWHSKFIHTVNQLVQPDRNGAIWSNRREILVFADAFRQLFESDEFRLIEGESERLREINHTMKGFDIDAFLDLFNIDLNPITVFNVDLSPQPFWVDSSVAHRLLVWCLHKKGRVKFIRGRIEGYNHNRKAVRILRTITGKIRELSPNGIVVRHGVGQQSEAFLQIQGLLIDLERPAKTVQPSGHPAPAGSAGGMTPDEADFHDELSRTAKDVAGDGRRLVSLLRLSNELHPETEKFFRHTVKHLR